MKNIILSCVSLLVFSCDQLLFEEEPSNDPITTFEYLWQSVDERYSFFEYKNIDWENAKRRYEVKINKRMSDEALFNVLFDMLGELRDGHVNLVSDFQVSRYDITLLGPENYNGRLIKENYLSEKYYITGGFSHDFLKDENIGYVRYASFEGLIEAFELDFIANRYRNTDGIIFDMRQNGGGSVQNLFTLVNRFVDEKTLLYKSRIKTGPEHDDFGEDEEANAEPVDKDGRFTRMPIILLTDRGSYSATSFFAVSMLALDNVTIVGDTTGGGLGMPNGGQLPNGWTYRFSVSQTIAIDGNNYEDGVPPNIQVDLDSTDKANGIDTILERAIAEIKK